MQVIQKIKFLLHRSLIPGSSDPGSGNRLRCSRSTYIKNQRNIRIIGSVSLILLLTLTAFTLRPVSVSTDFAEATANPATTTLTVATSSNAAILDITPSSTSGTFSSSDNSGTSLAFNVSTNNITGYNLSISHASSTTPAPLVNEDLPSGSTTNDSNSLSSLPAGTSITDSAFNTSTYKGYYGYKPSKLNSQSNSNYIPAPTTSSTTLNKTTQANIASDEYTIALGANIDYTKSAGTYTNTFILTAVANNVSYTINYLDNTGSGGTTGTDVSNLPATESASTATASSFTLSSTTPTRTGYTFNKWCDGTVTHNAAGNDTCSGTTYSAGSAYSFSSPSSTSTNTANLYAMWNVKTYSLAITFAGSGSGSVTKTSATANINQSTGVASSTYANSLATKDTVTVPGASELTIELNYSMEASWDYLYIFKGTYTGDVTKNMSAGQLYTYNTASGSSGQYANYNTATITVPGDTVTFAFYSDSSNAYYGYYARVTGNANVSSVSNVKVCKTAGNCSGNNLIGTVSTSGNSVSGLTYNTKYYLYPTFSSGYTLDSWSKTSTYGTLSSTTSTNPTFTMGAGTGKVTITGKAQTYTISLSRSNASAIIIDGTSYTGSSATLTYGSHTISGTYPSGYEFSSWSTSNSTNLAITSTSSASTTITVHGAATLTLIGKTSKLYIQDFTASMCKSQVSATVYDKRDEQAYTVRYINGNCWMTKNLAIGCNGNTISSKSLTSADSNVSSSWSTPAASLDKNDGTSGCTTSSISGCNDFTNPRMKCNSTYGAWYNYAAASAGTITGSSNSTADTYNICPKGWTLPTYSQQSGITSYSTAFSPVTGGYYVNGYLHDAGEYGFWWSATTFTSDDFYRYILGWADSQLYTNSTRRDYSSSVRCVRSS